MSVRTSHKTVTFTRPFSLSALDEVQAAGTYTVQMEEALLPGLSFPAWRRIATLIFLPSRPGGAFVEQVVNIDPLELEAAQARDAASALQLVQGGPGRLAGSAEPSASGLVTHGRACPGVKQARPREMLGHAGRNLGGPGRDACLAKLRRAGR
jgi:hypothetical protein